ncbi:S-4TM family putative pore-forming effector [Aureimonas psammosilenae]|uniref:S-4TM family putative pore-forming effector n=1 Tax=Aureimonas psammosilenae TaxID=2495496 RepID=UPI001260817B|nr:S-4TM family putative pore-forming effector [Aureimonas psammosilenae]
MTATTIPVVQNTEPFLTLLRARSQFYAEAGKFQQAQFVLTVCLPFIAGLVGVYFDTFRPFAAAVTLIITVVDTTFIDREFRHRLKVAARVCERFDCDLYGLPWKMLVAGKPVDFEDISKAAQNWKRGDGKLVDWYPKAVDRAPLEFARFVCQRANLWYDSTLRRGYARSLFIGAWLALAILAVMALARGLDLLNFFMSIAPAAPMMVWAIREGLRQNDAATANDTLKGEVETAIKTYISGALDAGAATQLARDIQDGIFLRRIGTTPLLIPQLYHWRRSSMEGQMNDGADALLKRAGF